MTKRFEENHNLDRENKAKDKFLSLHPKLSHAKKLGPNDIDFQLFSGEELVGFAEVKGRHKLMSEAYPLPIAIRKLNKLQGEQLPRVKPSVIIWACDDGIIYGKTHKIKGVIKYGGRKPREGSVNDQELMAFYPEQDNLSNEKY
jgi:hypothetical protein|tara:strand:+ start:8021 stop:8452 length:432 start_codon:yes stop_codon:yes gene_type:complete